MQFKIEKDFAKIFEAKRRINGLEKESDVLKVELEEKVQQEVKRMYREFSTQDFENRYKANKEVVF
jgi:hypothetical protein